MDEVKYVKSGKNNRFNKFGLKELGQMSGGGLVEGSASFPYEEFKALLDAHLIASSQSNGMFVRLSLSVYVCFFITTIKCMYTYYYSIILYNVNISVFLLRVSQ
jgi:hypothetical protein